MYIAPETLIAAQDEAEHHISQIQGFLYESRGTQLHLIRDLTINHPAQTVWSMEAPKSEYDEAHEKMRAALRFYQAQAVTNILSRMLT